METQNKRIDWISKAKGFGILGIVAVHTLQRFNIAFVSSIVFAGNYCVQLFFIISAYLSFKSLEKNKGRWNWKAYLKYLLHKIIRLVPVLYTAVAWHFAMRCIEIGGIPGIHDTVWRKVFFAVTFLNGFSYNFINPWMNWYIGDLIVFIALAPLLKKIADTPKKSVVLFVISVPIGYLSTLILNKSGIDTGWYFYCWLPRQFPLLAAGIVFYYFERAGSFEEIRDEFYLFVFFIVFGFLLSKCWKSILENHVQYGILLFVLSYTAFSKLNTGRFFNWLKTFGDNSYGIYLYHGCLLPLAGGLVSKIGFSKSSYGFVACYVLVFTLSLGISVAVNKFIEKPLFSLTRRKFGV